MPIENAQGVAITPGALADVAAPVAVPQLSLPAFQAAIVDPTALTRGVDAGAKIGGIIGQALEKAIYPFTDEGKAAKLAKDLAAAKLAAEVRAAQQSAVLTDYEMSRLGIKSPGMSLAPREAVPQSGGATPKTFKSLLEGGEGYAPEMASATPPTPVSPTASTTLSKETKPDKAATKKVPSLSSGPIEEIVRTPHVEGGKIVYTDSKQPTPLAREIEQRKEYGKAGVPDALKEEDGRFTRHIDDLAKDYEKLKKGEDKGNKSVDPFLMSAKKLADDLDKMDKMVFEEKLGVYQFPLTAKRQRLKLESEDIERGLKDTSRAQMMARINGSAPPPPEADRSIPIGSFWNNEAQARVALDHEKEDLANRIATFYAHLGQLPTGLAPYMKSLVAKELSVMGVEIPKELEGVSVKSEGKKEGQSNLPAPSSPKRPQTPAKTPPVQNRARPGERRRPWWEQRQQAPAAPAPDQNSDGSVVKMNGKRVKVLGPDPENPGKLLIEPLE